MGKAEREKGKRFEREVARALRERLPHLADRIRRTQQSDGAHGSDVTLPSWWVECHHGGVSARKKLAQAVSDAEKAGHDGIPVAVVKRNVRGEAPMVCLRMEDWLFLLAERDVETRL